MKNQDYLNSLTKKWRLTFDKFFKFDGSRYEEIINATFKYHPIKHLFISHSNRIVNTEKIQCMLNWIINADNFDKSILEKFTEYDGRTDAEHEAFNSNYGWHFFANGGFKYCVDILTKNAGSRRAIWMINSNEAMSNKSIDQLCTNSVQFFIRDSTLIMVVQMRSSNIVTLLPYDICVFSIFYICVFSQLRQTYPDLKVNDIFMQIASLHYYNSNIQSL